jgi:hypothetical protein
MIPATTLALPAHQHHQLQRHLFPGDGLEAAAILACTIAPGPRLRLLVRELLPVPYSACQRRQRDGLTWPGEYLEKAIDLGEPEKRLLVPIHSHPSGRLDFSEADDRSDFLTMRSLLAAYGDVHGTAIMTSDGAIRARLYRRPELSTPVDLVTVAGHDIRYWWNERSDSAAQDRPLAFTTAMTAELGRLSAAVVGVSGTGSIVAEQLARMGFGIIYLIDFDKTELRNLNRILNSTLRDAKRRMPKVEMMAAAISTHRGPGVAVPIACPILTRDAVLAASQADVLFSCVDSLEGRHAADLISAAFLLPLFDVGVSIPVRKTTTGFAIAEACARIDYVQPGGSTLADREVYSPESLRAEYLRKVAPDAHQQEVDAGYIRGLVEEAPSVITLNMQAASACANEYIARAYPYRIDPNEQFARTVMSLAAGEVEHYAESSFTAQPNPILALGSQEPLLRLPALSAARQAA